MTRINVRRVILGGLVAGLVANAFDAAIAGFLLASDLEKMMARLDLGAPFGLTLWVFAGVDFLWGVLLVFTYAAIRPRFGPGPKTAVLSGVLPWLAMSLLEAQITSMGIQTVPVAIKGGLLYLVAAIVSSLAGSALYKEDERRLSTVPV